ncbi:MAG TPA: serine hydrolase domain-containing protein [Flavisolibacter sp.]|nr:serine hydrolase domain-containing protein [Flavisolibacter sp.]
MNQFFPFAILVAFISFQTAEAQKKLTQAQLKKLDSIATQDVPPGAPGIATAILADGEVIYQKMAGYADLVDSSLIDARTRFNLASNGKQFTALAVLQLIDRGRLRLSDDIRTYLPAIFPAIKEKITIEHLLTHTSGIRDVYDLWSLQGLTWWEQSFSNEDVWQLLCRQQELNFKPGSSYLYSNSNYILLALLVEKRTGKSFVEVTNGLFQQLGMKNTSFENNYRKIRGPIAKAYFNFGKWTTYNWIWNVCGDGNLFSTLADQVKWEQIIQGRTVPGISSRLISKSQQLVSASSAQSGYGYGVEFGSYKGLDYLFHEGATGAWKATVIRFPQYRISMITLTNTGKSIPYQQTRQMADVVFDKSGSSGDWALRPAAGGSYVEEEDILGTYLTNNDFAFRFLKKGEKLYLRREGRGDVELEREGDNVFHQKYDTAFKQAFSLNKDREMEVTAYYTTHAPYSLIRKNSNWGGYDYNALAGRYINAETNVELTISYQGDKNYAVKIGARDTSTGLLVSPGKLLAGGYRLILPGDDKEQDNIFLDGDRIKRVRFRRLR